MKAKIFSYAVLISFSTLSFVFAQESKVPTLNINSSSVTQVPADAIHFSITLSIQNTDPQKAFEEHKTLEKIFEYFQRT